MAEHVHKQALRDRKAALEQELDEVTAQLEAPDQSEVEAAEPLELPAWLPLVGLILLTLFVAYFTWEMATDPGFRTDFANFRL